jgi:hypothetical protein
MSLSAILFLRVDLRRSVLRLGAGLIVLSLGATPAQAAFQGEPSPLTDAHLKILRPADFLAPTGGLAATVASDGAAHGRAVTLGVEPVGALFNVRHAAEYAVWVRVGQLAGERQPVRVNLSTGGKPVLEARINEGAGAAALGGPDGLREYTRRAGVNTPRNEAVNNISLQMDRPGGLEAQFQKDSDAASGGDLADEVLVESRQGTADQWVNLHRVENPGAGNFHWWKVGQAALAPGEHALSLSLAQPPRKGQSPVVDAVLLTAATNLVYPYVADITAPRASYVRFRIDRMPPGGVTLSISLLTHVYPHFYSGVGYCNPDGMNAMTALPHSRTGYTRWYCLQDLENAPGPTHWNHQAFRLRIGGNPKAVEGATQFAMWPCQDDVVREFSWQEPSGCNVSMKLDFEKYPDQLRTFRDHAREHYEEALKATGGRLFPLTRADMSLSTGGGGDEGSLDYVAKTLRMLGMNGGGPAAYASAFGMGGGGGGTLPGMMIPENEEVYRPYFIKACAGFQKLSTNVALVQICDEPGEFWGTALSAPLWVWEERTNAAPRWVDYAGKGELHTRFLGYSNCVLEGTFERQGNFDWRVGCDTATNPSTYGLFRIGKVNPYLAPENLAYSLVSNGTEIGRSALVHKAAGAKSGSFRLVWDGTRAALYLNDSLLAQLNDVPASGGFGIANDRKAITALRIRPIRRAERLAPEAAGGAAGDLAGGGETAELTLDLEEELSANDTPGRLNPKPLKAFVEEDWVVGGGMTSARPAYQAWLRTQGAGPELFGKMNLDEAGPMLIRELATTPEMRRAYYWGRRYSGFLTPFVFSLIMDGIRANAPRKDIQGFVGLSGDAMDVHQQMAMDMFQLAQYTNGLVPGVSDWSTAGTGSEQVNAFNAAFFNAGARRFGSPPASKIMMHVVHPTTFRAYTSLANNVKFMSYYTFGPVFVQAFKDWWSDRYHCYPACSLVNNRITQIDDLVAPGLLRPSRVAMFYAMSAHYWGDSLVRDKRMAFMALANDYFQPELVNEDHVVANALEHFDALYVLESHAASAAQAKIKAWVENGGLLWMCADAGTLNEYNEPQDLLETVAGARRRFAADPPPAAAKGTPPVTVSPVKGEADFVAHTVTPGRMAQTVEWPGARVRAVYDDGRPAWLEKAVGKGRVVYIGHRAALTYASKKTGRFWSDTGRATLTAPLHEGRIRRACWLSEPCFMTGALSTTGGTVVVLYNALPDALENVTLNLEEPRKPHSVEIFDGYRLAPLAYDYADGIVSAKLPPFVTGQMVVVRRAPAPDDYARKLAAMKAQAEALLASTNEVDLSAGAFLAAADPEWGLAGKVAPLLSHGSWMLRRQAAETLGWLGHTAGGDALAAAAAREEDAHALAEQILALARLKHPKARDLIAAHVTGAEKRIHVKRMSVLAATEWLFGSGARTNEVKPAAADVEFGRRIAECALADPDARVQREGTRLREKLDGAAPIGMTGKTESTE